MDYNQAWWIEVGGFQNVVLSQDAKSELDSKEMQWASS